MSISPEKITIQERKKVDDWQEIRNDFESMIAKPIATKNCLEEVFAGEERPENAIKFPGNRILKKTAKAMFAKEYSDEIFKKAAEAFPEANELIRQMLSLVGEVGKYEIREEGEQKKIQFNLEEHGKKYNLVFLVTDQGPVARPLECSPGAEIVEDRAYEIAKKINDIFK